eukprot:2648656-Amphidinium_carterae.2
MDVLEIVNKIARAKVPLRRVVQRLVHWFHASSEVLRQELKMGCLAGSNLAGSERGAPLGQQLHHRPGLRVGHIEVAKVHQRKC